LSPVLIAIIAALREHWRGFARCTRRAGRGPSGIQCAAWPAPARL